jgi:2'-5' RNA ligase
MLPVVVERFSMSTYRLFIAIELPADLIKALVDLQDNLKEARPVQWVKPAHMHLTLQFLGDVPVAQVEPLIIGLEKTIPGQNRLFDLSITGIGVFPSLKRPRVIWVGIQGNVSALNALQADVVKATQSIGIRPDKRPYKAHLTLGRVDKRARSQDYRQIGQLIRQKQSGIGQVGQLKVTHIHLIRSQLKPGGPIYTPLAKIDF